MKYPIMFYYQNNNFFIYDKGDELKINVSSPFESDNSSSETFEVYGVINKENLREVIMRTNQGENKAQINNEKGKIGLEINKNLVTIVTNSLNETMYKKDFDKYFIQMDQHQ